MSSTITTNKTNCELTKSSSTEFQNPPSLYVYVCFSLSLSLSFFSLSLSLSLCLSLCVYRSLSLSLCLTLYIGFRLLICLPDCLCLPASLPAFLPLYLSNDILVSELLNLELDIKLLTNTSPWWSIIAVVVFALIRVAFSFSRALLTVRCASYKTYYIKT